MQREVAEHILHTKGLGHRAIHGWEADTVSVRRRYDLAALVRRVAASRGRRALSYAFGVSALTATATASVAGDLWLGIVGAFLWVSTVAVYRAPDWVYEAPDPVFERGRITSDGMTDKELMRRFAIATERERFKKEKEEEAAKRERRKAKAKKNF